mgnify:CR=1 FL=1
MKMGKTFSLDLFDTSMSFTKYLQAFEKQPVAVLGKNFDTDR